MTTGCLISEADAPRHAGKADNPPASQHSGDRAAGDNSPKRSGQGDTGWNLALPDPWQVQSCPRTRLVSTPDCGRTGFVTRRGHEHRKGVT
jgi:hypothetical protein